MDHSPNIFTAKWSRLAAAESCTDIYSQYVPSNYKVRWSRLDANSTWITIKPPSAKSIWFPRFDSSMYEAALPILSFIFIVTIYFLSLFLLTKWDATKDWVCVVSWQCYCAATEARRLCLAAVKAITRAVVTAIKSGLKYVLNILKNWIKDLISLLPIAITVQSPIKLTWRTSNSEPAVPCTCGTYRLLDYCLRPWDHEDDNKEIIAQFRTEQLQDQAFIDQLLSQESQEQLALKETILQLGERIDHAAEVEKHQQVLENDLEQLHAAHQQQTVDLGQLRLDPQQQTQELQHMDTRATEAETALKPSQNSMKELELGQVRIQQEALQNAEARVEKLEALAKSSNDTIDKLKLTVKDWEDAANSAGTCYAKLSKELSIKMPKLEDKYKASEEAHQTLLEDHEVLKQDYLTLQHEFAQCRDEPERLIAEAVASEKYMLGQAELRQLRADRRAIENELKDRSRMLEWKLRCARRNIQLGAEELGEEKAREMDLRAGLEALTLETQPEPMDVGA